MFFPFGGIIEDSNPGFAIPLGFAGGLHDRELGFVRFGFRDYDTYTSRWTAPDLIGDAGGDSDWYGYCLDDPVNGVDPLGLWTKGTGLQASGSAFGFGAGGGLSWVRDDKGSNGLEVFGDWGASSGWGASIAGTHQETNAKNIKQLEGTSYKAGVEVGFGPGLGAEIIKGDGYTGVGGSVGIKQKYDVSPLSTHIKKEQSKVFTFDDMSNWFK